MHNVYILRFNSAQNFYIFHSTRFNALVLYSSGIDYGVFWAFIQSLKIKGIKLQTVGKIDFYKYNKSFCVHLSL